MLKFFVSLFKWRTILYRKWIPLDITFYINSRIQIHLKLQWHINTTNRRISQRICLSTRLVSKSTTDRYSDRDPGSALTKNCKTIKHTIDSISSLKPLLHNADWNFNFRRTNANRTKYSGPVYSKAIHKGSTFCVYHWDDVSCSLSGIYPLRPSTTFDNWEWYNP